MKSIKTLLSALFVFAATAAVAQDFSDPRYAKWGETPEQRRENVLASTFLKEEVNNRNFNTAAKFLQQLLANCPAASENTYANGVKLYKQKINRAESVAEKNVYVDSLLLLYDLRLEHFASHPKRGRVYLLERKAREFLTYKADDREGVRSAFELAISAQTEANGGVADPELVAIYFKNICDDYANGFTDAMDLVNVYDANAIHFENITPEQADFKKQFEDLFAMSGAASCENIEAIFSKKMAAAPEDVKVVMQAYALLGRAKCDSEFFFTVGEKLYSMQPSADVAMTLATKFQDKKRFDKANQYLREAFASETTPEGKEKLLVSIGMLEMATNNIPAAVESFRAAGELNPENAYVPFFLAQCYVSGSDKCGEGLGRQAIYWVAYDLMQRAIPLLESSDPDRVDAARQLAAQYRSAFPTKEECFFNELSDGDNYTVNCGYVRGVQTSVRPRLQ